MCWSGEASAVLAVAGLGTAAYVAYKGESKELWQAATYVYIDLCDYPSNQVLTLFGYLHVAFQPFFVNMVAMYFIPKETKEKIQTVVYTICTASTVAMLVKMYPFVWAGNCVVGVEGFCGTETCSVSGDWHIAWQMPLNGLMSTPNEWLFGYEWGLHVFAYALAAFYVPLMYGSWRFVGFHYLIGPLISDITTDDPNEYAAVWCLFSIALCVSVIKTPIRKYLHVKSWPFYPKDEEVVLAKKD